MAYDGEWLEGYGLAPEPEYENPASGGLLPIGCAESLISLELGQCLIQASRNLPYRLDAPLEIPRGDSIIWLRKVLLSPVCVPNYREWMGLINPCESPIEAVAFLGLCAALSIAEIPLLVTKAGEVPKLPVLDDRMVVAQIALQEPVDKYRIDIALHFNCRLGGNLYRHNVAIECDGFEYHSSPLQLAHDDAKERDLLASGFSVFRFTGKDIWNDAQPCTQQITKNLLSYCRRLIDGPRPNVAYQIRERSEGLPVQLGMEPTAN
jgi:very-short-patch-repair endonuclease